MAIFINLLASFSALIGINSEVALSSIEEILSKILINLTIKISLNNFIKKSVLSGKESP